jgi:hypothetical protein
VTGKNLSQPVLPAPPAQGSTQVKARIGMKYDWFNFFLVTLFFIIMVLTLFLLIRGEDLKPQSGSGSVTGIVQTSDGEGAVAEIFIIGGNHSTYSSEDGSFQLDGIASGEKTLVVGYQGMGITIPVNVQDDSVVDIGIIQVEATVSP